MLIIGAGAPNLRNNNYHVQVRANCQIFSGVSRVKSNILAQPVVSNKRYIASCQYSVSVDSRLLIVTNNKRYIASCQYSVSVDSRLLIVTNNITRHLFIMTFIHYIVKFCNL